ncbi:MAG: 2-oxoacid:acceptor oxidoreductase family protein, partial [Lachnospiraceae bacterium]|nr:2-oxoacid:acceptor oxidoreductase family protein [Lachnospiraceae bacterium]
MGLKETLASGREYYEVRLESIGGLGANLCGKMLGELGVKYLDVNSTNFSSYGSEKTGTPVKGFIRYCDVKKEIREHSPVEKPDLLIVFHQALLKDASVLKGCDENTSIVLALEPGQETVQIPSECKEQVSKSHFYGLEAQRIAMETKSRINVVMLGAALRLMGMGDTSVGQLICKDTLGKKYPDALAANIEGMKRGYDEIREMKLPGKENLQESGPEKKVSSEQQRWGYRTAPVGGVNPHFVSTVIADLSPSRQGYIPI